MNAKNPPIQKSSEKGMSLLEAMLAIAVFGTGTIGGIFLYLTFQESLAKSQTAQEMIAITKAAEESVLAQWGYLRSLPDTPPRYAESLLLTLPADHLNRWIPVTIQHKIIRLKTDQIRGFLPTGAGIQRGDCVPGQASCGECLITPIGGRYHVFLMQKIATPTPPPIIHIIVNAVARNDQGTSTAQWQALGDEIYGRLPYSAERPTLTTDFDAFTMLSANYPCDTGVFAQNYIAWASILKPVQIPGTIELPSP